MNGSFFDPTNWNTLVSSFDFTRFDRGMKMKRWKCKTANRTISIRDSLTTLFACLVHFFLIALITSYVCNDVVQRWEEREEGTITRYFTQNALYQRCSECWQHATAIIPKSEVNVDRVTVYRYRTIISSRCKIEWRDDATIFENEVSSIWSWIDKPLG